MPWKPDYLTLADVKGYARISDTVDDAELSIWITAASRAIDNVCNRQFGQVAAPVTRTYRRPAVLNLLTGLWELEIDDLQDTTGLLVNGVAYASAGATLLPDTAALDGLPYTRIGLISQPTMSAPGAPYANVVTARFGWTAVPQQVVGAGKLQVSRWAARRDSPYGIAGSPEQGSELRLLARLDPDVRTSLLGLSRRRRVG